MCWQNVYRPDITILVDWHQVTYVLLLLVMPFFSVLMIIVLNFCSYERVLWICLLWGGWMLLNGMEGRILLFWIIMSQLRLCCFCSSVCFCLGVVCVCVCALQFFLHSTATRFFFILQLKFSLQVQFFSSSFFSYWFCLLSTAATDLFVYCTAIGFFFIVQLKVFFHSTPTVCFSSFST